MFTSYSDRGTSYAAQKGVRIKYERKDFVATGDQEKEKLYAIGPGRENWFPCRIDAHGNVCDADGVVVFPSMSGKHPLRAGDKGYFGYFSENFGRFANPDLPSVSD